MSRRHAVTAVMLAWAASSCSSSEPAATPTLDDLQGEWSMSWTEEGDGVRSRLLRWAGGQRQPGSGAVRGGQPDAG